MCNFKAFLELVRGLLREIREIKADVGYSSSEILLAMIAAALLMDK